MGFPDPAVVQAAQRLVSDHQGKFSQTSRILQQVIIWYQIIMIMDKGRYQDFLHLSVVKACKF